MKIVDPGFRPRRMLEGAEALALVHRAADASPLLMASSGAASTTGATTAATSTALAPMDPGLAKIFRHHNDGSDPIVTAHVAHVQRLWGGMGAVLEVRAETSSGCSALVIVKKILLPDGVLSVGDQRKKDSYECESRFYETMAAQLRQAGCSVPTGLLVGRSPGTINIVMSKMPGSATSAGLKPEQQQDAAEKLAAQYQEYGQRVYSSESDEPDGNCAGLSPSRTAAAIDFLAKLHGHTWGSARADSGVARGLQSQGGHWYLDTRLDVWAAMPTLGWEGRLRRAAHAIDERLKGESIQCIIHGDPKPDNMCIDSQSGAVSMCDFQYCGRASPMKDLAYLLCCAADAGCSPASSQVHLKRYHEQLSAVLCDRGASRNIAPIASW